MCDSGCSCKMFIIHFNDDDIWGSLCMLWSWYSAVSYICLTPNENVSPIQGYLTNVCLCHKTNIFDFLLKLNISIILFVMHRFFEFDVHKFWVYFVLFCPWDLFCWLIRPRVNQIYTGRNISPMIRLDSQTEKAFFTLIKYIFTLIMHIVLKL